MRKWKLMLLGALVALSVVATGCLRISQMFTIYPDGSGKAEIKVTLMGMMAAQAIGAAGQGGQDPADQIREMVKGKVFWKDLQAGPGDAGTFVMSGTGYFEDIADVELEQGGLTFVKTEDGGYKLEISGGDMAGGIPGMPGGGMDGMPDEQKAQMKQRLKGLLAGFEVKMGFTLPGTVTAIEGFTDHEARSAYFRLDEEAVGKIMDEETKPPSGMMAISGGDAEGLAAEWEAFKKELAEAKAADAAGGSGDSDGGSDDKDDDSEQF